MFALWRLWNTLSVISGSSFHMMKNVLIRWSSFSSERRPINRANLRMILLMVSLQLFWMNFPANNAIASVMPCCTGGSTVGGNNNFFLPGKTLTYPFFPLENTLKIPRTCLSFSGLACLILLVGLEGVSVAGIRVRWFACICTRVSHGG
jgi:hypothetical protein